MQVIMQEASDGVLWHCLYCTLTFTFVDVDLFGTASRPSRAAATSRTYNSSMEPYSRRSNPT
jgi:hypothetical protein